MDHLPIPTLDDLDVQTGLTRIVDRDIFWISMPYVGDETRWFYAVGADDDGICGVVRLGGKEDSSSTTREQLLRDGVFPRPDENLSVHLSAFGLIRSPGRSERDGLRSGDIAVGLGQLAVRHSPALKEVERIPIVDRYQVELLQRGLQAIRERLTAARLEMLDHQADAAMQLPFRHMGLNRMPLARVRIASDACRTYPTLARLLATTELKSSDEDSLVHGMLEQLGWSDPSRRRALLRRLRGADTHLISRLPLRFLSKLPVDWIPSGHDKRGWAAVNALAAVVFHGSRESSQPVNELAGASRGRWSDFIVHLCQAAGCDAENEIDRAMTFDGDVGLALASPLASRAKDIRDLREDFQKRIALPLLAHVMGDARNLRAYDDLAQKLSTEALFQGRGLYAILRTSREWHTRGVPGGGAGQEVEWPALLPDWRDLSTGLSIVALRSRLDLMEEGLRGVDRHGASGLAHCVAGYWLASAHGKSRILSIREEDESGFTRVSTVEMRFGREGILPTVGQHRGYDNGEPGEAAERALTSYLEALTSKELTIDWNALRRAREQAGSVELEAICGYDWRDREQMEAAWTAWLHFIGGTFRNASMDELLEQVRTRIVSFREEQGLIDLDQDSADETQALRFG